MGQVGVPLLPAGRVGWEHGDGTPGRFLNACHIWRQHRTVQHLWPWSEPETGHIGPGLDFSGEIPIQTPFAKAFRYTNHMERLADGRIVASDLLSIHFSFHPVFLPAGLFPCPEVV